jgi:hypothetical protein
VGDSLNITTAAIGELPWRPGELRGSLNQLFRWAEQHALTAHDWYIREKKSKSRWSKSLRVLAIASLAVGGLVPIISLASHEAVDSGWGYVALAVGASFVVADRGFGFSAAWMRYLKTAAALAVEISSRQLEWVKLESALLGQEPTPEQAAERIEFLREFCVGVDGMVAAETEEWCTEFSSGLNQLATALASRDK